MKIRMICDICGRTVIAPKFYFENTKTSGICILVNDSGMSHIKIERQRLYNSIPIKKKEIFLQLLREGKNVKEAYSCAELTFDEALAMLDMNIIKETYYRLSKYPVNIQAKNGGED